MAALKACQISALMRPEPRSHRPQSPLRPPKHRFRPVCLTVTAPHAVKFDCFPRVHLRAAQHKLLCPFRPACPAVSRPVPHHLARPSPPPAPARFPLRHHPPDSPHLRSSGGNPFSAERSMPGAAVLPAVVDRISSASRGMASPAGSIPVGHYRRLADGRAHADCESAEESAAYRGCADRDGPLGGSC